MKYNLLYMHGPFEVTYRYSTPAMDRFTQEFSNYKGKASHSILITENIFDLIYKGNIKAVNTEINKGISMDFRNNKGQTLLHYALLYNQIEIAKLLILQGADLSAEDNSGQKVKHIIQTRYPDLYSKLEEYTPDLPVTILEERELVGGYQVQELGKSNDGWNDCCCIIS